MRMGQGVRTGLGHGGITCVLQTQFSSFLYFRPNCLKRVCQEPDCLEIIHSILGLNNMN